MSAVGLDIVTCGWELPRWKREFYPEDLPEDWQLTYFANEFPAVMAAAKVWSSANESQIESWFEDVPQDFRFYLEQDRTVASDCDLDRVRRVLGGKLAGVVREVGAASTPPAGAMPCFDVQTEPDRLSDAGCCAPAWRIPRAYIDDLRAGRAWLEELALTASGGRGLLLLSGVDVGIDHLRRWRHLVWLLGLA